MKSVKLLAGKRIRLVVWLAVATAAASGVLLITSLSVMPTEAKWEQVMEEAAAGSYRLIGTTDLQKRYREDRAGMIIVDTRQGWEFDSGHIRGAKNFPFEPTWWSRWWKRAAVGEFLGSDKHRFIVFY